MAANAGSPFVLHYYMKLYWGDPLDRLDEEVQSTLCFVGEAQKGPSKYLLVHPGDTLDTVTLRWDRGHASVAQGHGRTGRAPVGRVYKVERIPTFKQVGIQVAESGLQASRRMARRKGIPEVLLRARRA